MDFKEGVGAMIEKYFNGVIEQVYHRIGNAEKNIVMASYNNDFSVSGLENKKRYQEDDNVFFACCELQYETLSGAYAPFLDIICDMFRKFVKGDFEAFLRECGTYELHRSLFLGYYIVSYPYHIIYLASISSYILLFLSLKVTLLCA